MMIALNPAGKIPLANLEFNQPASGAIVEATARALEANGLHTIVVDTAEKARVLALALIPDGARVYNAPSRTLEQTGLLADIGASVRFEPVRPRLRLLDRITQRREIRQLTSSPDVIIGSVQAITQDGQVVLASATGSQMAAAVFGAGIVIWVVGVQKLVRNLDEGMRRIREYSHPLEDQRTRATYGQPSAINKLLIVNGEVSGRITIVLVKQILGF
jgi:hypothetical protein